MKLYTAESLREMPMLGKCYRITLDLYMDQASGFRWNIMCYERPSMMSLIENRSSEPTGDMWEITVRDFPEDLEHIVGMLKQKILMGINESFDEAMSDYKRFILK